ncbi:MAG: drug/metabolite transporter (DMT)-like permease [Planctomycetota bacterium]|jgi:drug/metabolite transporter (DMT)-like permease
MHDAAWLWIRYQALMSSAPKQWQAPSARTATVCVVLMCLIWGSTWIVIRKGLQDLPPFTSAGVRFAIAASIMVLVAGPLARREGGKAPTWRLRWVMGMCNFTISYGVVYWSELTLPSGLVSTLWATFPMMMAIMGYFLLPNERLRSRQWGGFVIALAGVILLFLTDLAALGPGAIPAGCILLISPAAAALGTVLVKRDGGEVSSILLNRDGLILGAVGLLTLAGIFERDAEMAWTASAIGSILYLAIAGTVVAFGLYFWLMRFVPATKLSLITYIIPVVALILGAVFADESFGLTTAGGLLGILAGVWMAKGKAPLTQVPDKKKPAH